MKKFALFLLIFLISSTAYAGSKEPKIYQEGVLIDVRLGEPSLFLGEQNYKIGKSTVSMPSRSMKIYHVIVQVDDLIYIGAIRVGWARTYNPEWIIGDPVQVRFKKNRMYLKKSNEKEAKFKVVKKVRTQKQPTSKALSAE